MSGRRRQRHGRSRRHVDDSDDEEEMHPIRKTYEALDDDDEQELISSVPTAPYTGEATFTNPSYCQAVANAVCLPYKVPKFKTMKPYIEKALREGTVYAIRSVYICACEAPSSRTSRVRNAIRWLVSWVSEVHHVEFVFRQEGDEKEKISACTVDFESPVHFDELNPSGSDYNTHFWDVYAVRLTPAQKFGVFLFCCWQENKPMNSSGIYLNFASGGLFAGSTPNDFDEDCWFCSQLIAAALKWVGVEEMQSVEPRVTTPGHLKAMMTSGSSRLFDKTDDHSLVPYDQYEV